MHIYVYVFANIHTHVIFLHIQKVLKYFYLYLFYITLIANGLPVIYILQLLKLRIKNLNEIPRVVKLGLSVPCLVFFFFSTTSLPFSALVWLPHFKIEAVDDNCENS